MWQKELHLVIAQRAQVYVIRVGNSFLLPTVGAILSTLMKARANGIFWIRILNVRIVRYSFSSTVMNKC